MDFPYEIYIDFPKSKNSKKIFDQVKARACSPSPSKTHSRKTREPIRKAAQEVCAPRKDLRASEHKTRWLEVKKVQVGKG